MHLFVVLSMLVRSHTLHRHSHTALLPAICTGKLVTANVQQKNRQMAWNITYKMSTVQHSQRVVSKPETWVCHYPKTHTVDKFQRCVYGKMYTVICHVRERLMTQITNSNTMICNHSYSTATCRYKLLIYTSFLSLPCHVLCL